MDENHLGPFSPLCHWFQQSPIALSEAKSLYVPQLKDFLEVSYVGSECSYDGVLTEDNFVLYRQGIHAGDRTAQPALEADDIRPRITFRGQTFFLAKVHVHHGTEHDVEGIPDRPVTEERPEGPRTYEIHLLHETFTAEYLEPKVVLAVYAMDDPKNASEAMRHIVSVNRSGPENSCAASLRVSSLLPANLTTFYCYEGSLTSKPYLETVSWAVFPELTSVHTETFRDIDSRSQKERDPQPLERRFVLRSFETVKGQISGVVTDSPETLPVKGGAKADGPAKGRIGRKKK